MGRSAAAAAAAAAPSTAWVLRRPPRFFLASRSLMDWRCSLISLLYSTRVRVTSNSMTLHFKIPI